MVLDLSTVPPAKTDCATLDLSTNILHIPCLNLDKPYWLDLKIEQGELIIDGFGESLPLPECSAFNLFTGTLPSFSYTITRYSPTIAPLFLESIAVMALTATLMSQLKNLTAYLFIVFLLR